MHRTLPILLVFASCGEPDKTPDTAEPTDTAETASSTDTSLPPDTATAETGDSSPVETSDTAVPVPAAPFSGVTVSVHPDVATLLQVRWTQDEAADAAWVTWTFENDDWSTSPRRGGEAGAHQEVLLGIPSNTEVTFRIVNEVGGQVRTSEETFTATTGPLPEDLPPVTLLHNDPTRAHPAPWVLSTIDVGRSWYSGPFWAFILDREGRYVWYRAISDSRCSLFAQVASDGTHILLDATTDWAGPDAESTITRLTLDGSYEEVLPLPDLGFTFDEIEGGVMLYEHRGRDLSLYERQPDGTEREVWNCSEFLKSIGERRDTCSPNSIVWNPGTNTVFWSMYQNDTVAEIDLGTSTLLRYFGQLKGGWAFDPPESVVDYQHYPSLNAEGNLVVSTHIKGESGLQRAREFWFDESAQTLVEVWTYGEEVEHYADYGGEAFRLDNGNTFICYGTDGALREVTPDGRTAWDVEWPTVPETHLTGHDTLIDDLYAINAGPVAR